jgi:hypothetical protein
VIEIPFIAKRMAGIGASDHSTKEVRDRLAR